MQILGIETSCDETGIALYDDNTNQFIFESLFSQAAKHAGISQPALSMAISKLEEKLDVTLFYRDTNGVVRSNIYSDFLSNEGGSIIKNVDDILLQLKSITKKNTGSVDFGVGNIVAESILPGALKSFCNKNKES